MTDATSRAVREPWPWIVAGILACTIGVSLTFARTAVKNPDPLVVDDAYQAGLAWNDEQRARARADAAGWRFERTVEAATGGVRVSLSLVDAEGAPLASDRLLVRRVRPSEGGYDADFELGTDGSALVPLPRPGRWHLVATAEREGAVLERVYEVRGSRGLP